MVKGSDLVIKDLNSTNGTFIEGDAVTEATLKPGQVLRLGMVELRYEDGKNPPTPAKKPIDHTQVVGVKLNDLESGPRQVSLGADGPFKKKSNKINTYFLFGIAALGVIVVVLLVLALMKSQ